MRRTALIFAVLLAIAISAPATATELKFQFRNPTFGGNPLNGSFLINKAQIQNDHEEDQSSMFPEFPEQSTLEDFEESIKRAILAGVSRQISDTVFGEEGMPPGTYTVGNIQIGVVDQLDKLQITLTDMLTNDTSTFTVPKFASTE